MWRHRSWSAISAVVYGAPSRTDARTTTPGSRRRHQTQQKGVETEQSAPQLRPVVAILDFRGSDDNMDYQILRVDRNGLSLALDLLARVISVRIGMGIPILRALDTLRIDDRCRRTGLP
jgi:hypothetical protein